MHEHSVGLWLIFWGHFFEALLHVHLKSSVFHLNHLGLLFWFLIHLIHQRPRKKGDLNSYYTCHAKTPTILYQKTILPTIQKLSYLQSYAKRLSYPQSYTKKLSYLQSYAKRLSYPQSYNKKTILPTILYQKTILPTILCKKLSYPQSYTKNLSYPPSTISVCAIRSDISTGRHMRSINVLLELSHDTYEHVAPRQHDNVFAATKFRSNRKLYNILFWLWRLYLWIPCRGMAAHVWWIIRVSSLRFDWAAVHESCVSHESNTWSRLISGHLSCCKLFATSIT